MSGEVPESYKYLADVGTDIADPDVARS